MEASARSLLLVWAVLLALLAASAASSFVPLGWGNAAVNLGIALLKAGLIVWYFMHQQHAAPLMRLAVLLGVFLLAVLLGLTAADHLTRGQAPAAWDGPQATTATQCPPVTRGRDGLKAARCGIDLAGSAVLVPPLDVKPRHGWPGRKEAP